jgi:hypothetical protein
VSSSGGLFQPYLIAFAQQFFVFVAFYCIFRKVGQQPLPQLGYGFFAVFGGQGCHFGSFFHGLVYRMGATNMLW